MENPTLEQESNERKEEIEWVKRQFLIIDPKIPHWELRAWIHQLIPTFDEMGGHACLLKFLNYLFIY